MKPLLLLHGAIGSEVQLYPLKDSLSKYYQVFTLNLSGHGGRNFSSNFSIEGFAKEVANWIEEKKVGPISIFGYSMGGYVALFLAHQFPHHIESIITLATKFHWDEQTAAKEAAALDPSKIIEKLPSFAEALKLRHHPVDWQELLNKTAALLQDIGMSNPIQLQDFSSIRCPVLLMLGDRDKMVTLVETVTVYKELNNGQLAVLPATPHPIEMADTTLLKAVIRRYLQ